MVKTLKLSKEDAKNLADTLFHPSRGYIEERKALRKRTESIKINRTETGFTAEIPDVEIELKRR